MPTLILLPCCVEAPPAFVPKARYALRTLLAPLGLAPAWTTREALSAGGLYYGEEPAAAPPGALALRLHPDTAAFFASGAPYDPADAGEVEAGGVCVPALFPRRRLRAPALSSLSPDLVASAFFWLAGWQETAVTARDVHGRFPFAASLQAALGCIGEPVVDCYRAEFGGALARHGVPVRRVGWAGRPWAVALTHDVDLLRKRRLGTVARALARRGGRRGAALRQAALDPNPRRTSIERLAAFERERGAGATYFFKTGATGAWDVPYSPASPYLRHRVADLQREGFEVGLHPSYFAHDHAGHLRAERDRLAALTGSPPATVRQHFLRFDPVFTPRLQAAAGFRLDSTLGFAEREGFRRGTAFPFRLFDAAANAPLGLWELPLHAMDTTLFTHRRLDGEAAHAALDGLFAACERVGGCCVLLWHNTVYDEVDYPGQAAAFEWSVARAQERGAAVLSLRDALSAFEAARPPADRIAP